MQPNREIIDSFLVYGHENVLGTHPTTLEFTKESTLSLKGDCIIGVNATKSASELSPKLKNIIQTGQKVRVRIEAGDYQDEFFGYGHPHLSLSNPLSMVFRKSEFISDRTILISCSKIAAKINRELIEYMKYSENTAIISFYADI